MKRCAAQLSVARFTGFVFHFYSLPSPDVSGLGYFRSSAARTLLTLCLLSSALIAAQSSYAQEKDPIDVVKVNTDLVVFDAQVIDKKSKRIIGDLMQRRFRSNRRWSSSTD